MRILFFIESLQAGGKERRAVELISYLKQSSSTYDIEIVLTEEEIHFDEIYKTGCRITVLKRKLKYDPGIFFRFHEVCKRFKPELIHTWGKMSTFYAIPSKILLKVPLVSNLIADTTGSSSKLSFSSILRKINVSFSDAVLSNSEAGLRAYGITTPRAKVIYNGVRLSRFSLKETQKDVRKEFGIRGKYIIIMVATFSHLKDHNLLLDIARIVARQRDDVTFLAVGDGPLLNGIRKRAEKESIKNVIFTGRRSDVERLISASDVGILCTFSEGISNSIIEYMALGKPVIVSDVRGGSPELITDGVTGYCVEREPFRIANLVSYLLDNADVRMRMGTKGKEKISKLFSVNRMGNEYQDLYDSLLGIKKTRSSAVIKNATVFH
ncbi:MAG TPA: glycosyltransferase [Bacteroidales bacterium]|nr:glycosyltransferase [Bacteroidales bacterium]